MNEKTVSYFMKNYFNLSKDERHNRGYATFLALEYNWSDLTYAGVLHEIKKAYTNV